MDIAATDYHTAGEPFRIVAEGAVEIPGESVLERREHARSSEKVERVRRLLCHEPRGHADMSVVVFADGEVDRLPTGSATSARTALLVDDGGLGDGESWPNDSIIGTSFDARVIGRSPGGVPTEVEGRAFLTGEHRFVLDPRDELGTGFVLR